ncbi:MAG: DfrA [Sphingobacteriales bacterium]|nr:DfrA [Sphingobacteriales bacterium]
MKQIINTNNAPAPIGPYSHAVKAGNMLFVSGQIPINPETNMLVEGSITDETRQVMENVIAILKEAGYSSSDIIKSTIFLTDMAYFAQANDVYSTYFESDFPARETVAVAGLPKNVNVEISVIAYNPNL